MLARMGRSWLRRGVQNIALFLLVPVQQPSHLGQTFLNLTVICLHVDFHSLPLGLTKNICGGASLLVQVKVQTCFFCLVVF